MTSKVWEDIDALACRLQVVVFHNKLHSAVSFCNGRAGCHNDTCMADTLSYRDSPCVASLSPLHPCPARPAHQGLPNHGVCALVLTDHQWDRNPEKLEPAVKGGF